MYRLSILLPAIVALALLPADQPSAAPVPEPRNLLLVSSNHTGNWEVFLINPQTGEARNLTNHKASDTDPVWSPDGNKIAFVSDREDTANIWVLTLNSSGLKQLTRERVGAFGPRWSPDGTRIAYVANREGTHQVVIMNADGSNVRQLTRNGFASRQPAWAPGSNRLSISRYGPGLYDTCRIDSDGSNEVNLTQGGGGLDAEWSPDGKRIVFTSIRKGGQFRVYLMSPDGDNLQDIPSSPNPWGNVYPTWSPDGKRLAYTDWLAGVPQIVVCNPDGKNYKQLTSSGRNFIVHWSRDGKQLAFTREAEDQPAALWVMDADGQNQRKVMEKSGLTYSWRPR
jgi:TolB protein